MVLACLFISTQISFAQDDENSLDIGLVEPVERLQPRHISRFGLAFGTQICINVPLWGDPILGLAVSYTFQFNNMFSFGFWAGIMQSFPLLGIRFVLGNKVDDLAISINAGLLPSVGLYYKNFYVNFFPSFLFPQVWNPEPRSFYLIPIVQSIYFEFGYSFYLGVW